MQIGNALIHSGKASGATRKQHNGGIMTLMPETVELTCCRECLRRVSYHGESQAGQNGVARRSRGRPAHSDSRRCVLVVARENFQSARTLEIPMRLKSREPVFSLANCSAQLLVKRQSRSACSH